VTVTVAQLKERTDAQVLIELTDRNGLVVDDVKLGHALADAMGIIDGYMFKLPDSDKPTVATLDAYQAALALYVLAGNRPGVEYDSIRARAKAATDYLAGLSTKPASGIDAISDGPTPLMTDADLTLFGEDVSDGSA
jgi:phage gp36-like protein